MRVKSMKKIYIGDIKFSDENDKDVYFTCYREEDVGINEDWQRFVINTVKLFFNY